MLNRELDYQQELVTTQWFHNKLKSNPNYIVLKPIKVFQSPSYGNQLSGWS